MFKLSDTPRASLAARSAGEVRFVGVVKQTGFVFGSAYHTLFHTILGGVVGGKMLGDRDFFLHDFSSKCSLRGYVLLTLHAFRTNYLLSLLLSHSLSLSNSLSLSFTSTHSLSISSRRVSLLFRCALLPSRSL